MQKITAILQNIETKRTKINEIRNKTAYIVQGKLKADSTLQSKITFHISERDVKGWYKITCKLEKHCALIVLFGVN